MDRNQHAQQERRVGSEVTRKKPAVLDLRAMQDSRGPQAPARRPTPPRPSVAPSARSWASEPVQPRTPAVMQAPVRETNQEESNDKPFTILNGFAYDLLIITGLSFVAIGSSFRDMAFLVYLAVAFVRRWESQRMFRSALFCLVLVPILQALNRGPAADMFAIFTFYFLSIGVIRAIFELRGNKKALA